MYWRTVLPRHAPIWLRSEGSHAAMCGASCFCWTTNIRRDLLRSVYPSHELRMARGVNSFCKNSAPPRTLNVSKAVKLAGQQIIVRIAPHRRDSSPVIFLQPASRPPLVRGCFIPAGHSMGRRLKGQGWRVVHEIDCTPIAFFVLSGVPFRSSSTNCCCFNLKSNRRSCSPRVQQPNSHSGLKAKSNYADSVMRSLLFENKPGLLAKKAFKKMLAL
jgi:hypothetical protein